MTFFVLVGIFIAVIALINGKYLWLVFTGVSFALAVRYYWVGIEADDEGVVVRSEFRTVHVPWPDIDHFKVTNWSYIRYVDPLGAEKKVVYYTTLGSTTPEKVVAELNEMKARSAGPSHTSGSSGR